MFQDFESPSKEKIYQRYGGAKSRRKNVISTNVKIPIATSWLSNSYRIYIKAICNFSGKFEILDLLDYFHIIETIDYFEFSIYMKLKVFSFKFSSKLRLDLVEFISIIGKCQWINDQNHGLTSIKSVFIWIKWVMLKISFKTVTFKISIQSMLSKISI